MDPVTLQLAKNYVDETITGNGGLKGEPGVGIAEVVQTKTSTESEGENVVTVTKTDGTSSAFSVRNGARGEPGATYVPEIGTVETVDSKSSASVTADLDQKNEKVIFNFSIPRGEKGESANQPVGAAVLQVSSVVVPSSLWINGKQTVSVDGILADEKSQIVIPIPSSNSEEAYRNARITASVLSDGKITFVAETIPNVDIAVNLFIFSTT